MNTMALAILFAGFVLLYGAIRNKNPLQVIKAAITNQPLDKVDPLAKAA